MRRTLLIEGLPYAWGETVPSWSECELREDLTLERVKLSHQIDPFGGVERWDDVQFHIADPDNKLAKLFRFYNSNAVTISDPNPLTYDYSSAVTLSSDNHPVAKAMFVDTETFKRGISYSKYYDNFTSKWAIVAWVTYGVGGGTIFYQHNNIHIEQSGNYIKVSTYDGGWSNVTGTVALNVGVANHIAVVQVSGTVYIYVNFVASSHALADAAGAVDTPFEILGSGALSSTTDCNLIHISVYKREVAAAEVEEHYYGRPVDPDELVLCSDMSPYVGQAAHDKSGYGNHITGLFDWVDRQFIPGDLLYLPQGSARINARIGSAQYQITQQVYSCLEDGYCPFYALVYPNEYVTRATIGGPGELLNRLIAYYEDNKLRYIGRLCDVQQMGKKWQIRAQHILKPLADGFKAPVISVQQANDWYISNSIRVTGQIMYATGSSPAFGFQDIDISGASLTKGLYSYSDIEILMNSIITDPEIAYNNNSGFQFFKDDILKLDIQSANTFAKVFFDNYPVVTIDNLGTYSSFTNGYKLPQHGAMLEAGAQIEILYGTPGINLEDADIIIMQDGEQYKSAIVSWNPVTSVITLGLIKKVSDNSVVGQLLITSSSPITFNIQYSYDADNLWELLYNLITSTGSGSNGDYDSYTGQVGLGLPSELINDVYQGEGNNEWAVDWAGDGKIDGDLQAFGLALIFADEQFKIVKIRPPQIQQITTDLYDADCNPGALVQVSWGHHQPMNSIKFKAGFDKEYQVNAISQNIWESSSLRVKDLASATNCKINNVTDWLALQASRLQWFASYAPTVQFVKINHDYTIGDIIMIKGNGIAGQGRYGTTGLPAVITKLIDDWIVEAVINTNPVALAAVWVPSLEIASYSGTTLTLRTPEGLLFDDLFDLPLTAQIIATDGTVLEASVTVTACTASTITLSAAPTYTQTTQIGILTLPDYTSALVKHREKYVWASDTSGVMSNTDDGKIML